MEWESKYTGRFSLWLVEHSSQPACKHIDESDCLLHIPPVSVANGGHRQAVIRQQTLACHIPRWSTTKVMARLAVTLTSIVCRFEVSGLPNRCWPARNVSRALSDGPQRIPLHLLTTLTHSENHSMLSINLEFQTHGIRRNRLLDHRSLRISRRCVFRYAFSI
jgi:hypothetical protein